MSNAVKHKAPPKKNKRKRNRVLRVFLLILGLTLAAALVLAGVLVIAPLTERADPAVVSGSADWMRKLDDAMPLNEIALPGTHNSAAQYTELAFFTKCQSLGIREQLDAGFRYLDLRLTMENGDSFRLTHDVYRCKTDLFGPSLTLDDVLADCYGFLDEHPGETVLLAVRQESGDESIRSCQLVLDAYIREAPERWCLSDTIPTLGEARGKLVLLRRWEDEVGLRELSGIPLRWRDQGGYGDLSLNSAAEEQADYTLYVQDRYEYDAADKWSCFLAGRRGTEDGAVSLNFLSTKGETVYGHPYEYAKELNARLLEADDAELGGWIIVDFGSAVIAERIWRLNFR